MDFKNWKLKEKMEKKSDFKTQRCFSNYFKMDYLDKNSDYWIEELVQIPDYDKKISYLIKKFPYPDLIKIIIKKLKFSTFQEEQVLEIVEETLGKAFEENEIKNLAKDLVDFTSQAQHIRYFNGDFHNYHAHVHYDIGSSYVHYEIGEDSTYNNSDYNTDNEINYEQQDIDTD